MVCGKSVAVANGGSAIMRNLPDIDAEAEPFTACSIYSSSQGGWIAVAAPAWPPRCGLGSPASSTPRG